VASGRGIQGGGDEVGAMVRRAAYIIGAELHGVPDGGQVQHHAPATMARLAGMFCDLHAFLPLLNGCAFLPLLKAGWLAWLLIIFTYLYISYRL
jgi:hypothetical protein